MLTHQLMAWEYCFKNQQMITTFIQFTSCQRKNRKKKYTSYELKVLALVKALKNFVFMSMELNLKLSLIVTCLRKLLTRKNSYRQACSVFTGLRLQNRTRSKMAHIDALSHSPCCMSIQDTPTLQILNAQKKNEHINVTKSLLETTS